MDWIVRFRKKKVDPISSHGSKSDAISLASSFNISVLSMLNNTKGNKCEQMCRGNPITKSGKFKQMFKMLVTSMIPIVLLIGMTGNDFITDITNYLEATSIRQTIQFSTELGMFLRYLQRERDMSSLYVSSIGPDTKKFLLKRYPETDFALDNMSSWPVQPRNQRPEFQSRDRFLTYLNRHRYQLDTRNRTSKDEILFYTELIEIFIGWLYEAITETNTGAIWKSLVAYQEIIVASEYIGRERGFGVNFYAQGKFRTRDDYLMFVEAQDIANVTFTSCRRYSQIAYEIYETEVRNKLELLEPIRTMRYEIRSNKTLHSEGSLEMASWWFENMSMYQDIVREAQIKIADKLKITLQDRANEDLRSIILISTIFGAVLILCPVLVMAVYFLTSQIQRYSVNIANRTKDLKKEKKRTDILLYQMLPKSIADKLKLNENVNAEHYEQATIFFSDIVGFTQICSNSSPLQVVDMLNSLYMCFDNRIEMYDVYKVETIGDAYMVVSGVPRINGTRHATEIGTLALDLLRHVRRLEIPHRPGHKFRLRIGCHSGPVAAGVVGCKMPRYCLFGVTVSVASKMESLGKANKIHISESTYDLLSAMKEFVMLERTDGIAEDDEDLRNVSRGFVRTYWLVDRLQGMANEFDESSSLSSNDQPDDEDLRNVLRGFVRTYWLVDRLGMANEFDDSSFLSSNDQPDDEDLRNVFRGFVRTYWLVDRLGMANEFDDSSSLSSTEQN